MKAKDALNALSKHLNAVAPDVQDRLPSERDLSAALGCSRSTLRKALDQLEHQGEIWRHVGQGTFRGARPRHLPIRENLLIEGATPQDLMHARLLIEPAVAAVAALKANPQDIFRLTQKVDEGRAARDRAACEQADDSFHQAVASVADNPILIGLLSFLSGARRRATWQRQWDRVYRRLGVDEFRLDHSDQHMAVVQAIELADESAAAEAMRAHLLVIEEAMTRPDRV